MQKFAKKPHGNESKVRKKPQTQKSRPWCHIYYLGNLFGNMRMGEFFSFPQCYDYLELTTCIAYFWLAFNDSLYSNNATLLA